MKSTWWIGAAGAVLLTATSAAQTGGRAALDKANKELAERQRSLMSTLRAVLVDRLKDPASAQFRREFLSASDGEPEVISLCGEVNSRNSYGGYVGFGGFIVTGERLVIVEQQEPAGAFEAIWQTWCAKPVAKPAVPAK